MRNFLYIFLLSGAFVQGLPQKNVLYFSKENVEEDRGYRYVILFKDSMFFAAYSEKPLDTIAHYLGRKNQSRGIRYQVKFESLLVKNKGDSIYRKVGYFQKDESLIVNGMQYIFNRVKQDSLVFSFIRIGN